MAENFYTILTNVGMAAIANAQVSQSKVDFANIAVGDSNGSYYNPVATATKLVNEVWRGPINSISLDETNPNWIIIETVIPATTGGFSVREIGVLDTNGTLLAIGKVPETYKPAAAQGSLKDLYLRIILEVSNASVVTLKVDPAVIFASKKYVDDKVASISQNTAKLIDAIGEIKDLKVENVNSMVEAINQLNHNLEQVKQGFDNHKIDPMPHMYVDNGKTYRWGFRTLDGKPQFIYEEVTK